MTHPLGRRAFAEFIATFTLIYVGAGSIVATQQILGSQPGTGGVGLVTIAIAHGLAIATMVSAIGHVSGGHINPAVSIAAWATGNLPGRDTGAYVGGQLLGGILGAAVLRFSVPADLWREVKLGTPLVADSISSGQAVLIEAVLTFFLVWVIFGTAVDPEGSFDKIAGLAIGFVVLMDIMMGGPFTGASMNPARTLGPGLVGGVWDGWWVYWVGPIAGGLAAGFAYDRGILGRRPGDHRDAV